MIVCESCLRCQIKTCRRSWRGRKRVCPDVLLQYELERDKHLRASAAYTSLVTTREQEEQEILLLQVTRLPPSIPCYSLLIPSRPHPSRPPWLAYPTVSLAPLHPSAFSSPLPLSSSSSSSFLFGTG